MPRKPTLSPSRIKTYLACPVRYRWRYVDPRGRWFRRAHGYYSFGATLHRAIQRYHACGGAGSVTVDQMLGEYADAWIEAGYSSSEESQGRRNEGRDLLLQYVCAEEAAPIRSATILLEKQLRKDMGRFVLVGRLDRVEEHPDGRLEIVDYKSGRSDVSDTEVRTDLAMGIYQLLVAHHFPGRDAFGTIIALRNGARASASFTQEERLAFEGDIVTLGEEIVSAEFDSYRPQLREGCWDCDYVRLCLHDAEFRGAYAEATADLEARRQGEHS